MGQCSIMRALSLCSSLPLQALLLCPRHSPCPFQMSQLSKKQDKHTKPEQEGAEPTGPHVAAQQDVAALVPEATGAERAEKPQFHAEGQRSLDVCSVCFFPPKAFLSS